MYNMKYLCLLFVAISHITLAHSGCYLDPSITTKEDKTEANRHLERLTSLRKQNFETMGEQYDFKLNICGRADNISLTQKTIDTEKPQTIVLGQSNLTTIIGGSNWVMFNYSGGDKYVNTCNNATRHSAVMFTCDPDVEHKDEAGTMTMLYEAKTVPCYYLFEVKTPVVCEIIDHGLSGGAIFFILLIVSLCCYFVFGFLYRRLVSGAQGIEQIPNRPFWFMLGNKFADCANMFCRCDTYCGPGNSGAGSSYEGYSPIEEQMARDLQDEDRDSALLRP